jgi:hypothetical protein
VIDSTRPDTDARISPKRPFGRYANSRLHCTESSWR